MTRHLRTTLAATLAALTMGAALVASSAPAAAFPHFHGHYGHYGHHGFGFGFAPAYYGGCYIARRPVHDRWGNFIGIRRVRVCG